MRQFLSTLKAVGRSRSLRRNGIKPLIRDWNNNATPIGNRAQVRFLSSIAGFDRYSCLDKCTPRNSIYPIGNLVRVNEVLQRRWFLGCGDGDEGSTVSKVHEERRVLGYSPQQLFDVVAAVDLYEDFLPWCQRSEIVRRYPDGSFDAELEIGFKFLVESYVSHVELDRPKLIKTTSSQSNLFEHLINIWEFSPGPTPDTCNVYFLVDFKFRSPIYRQVASVFFNEVVSHLVSSFLDRCRVIYGPEAQILQSN